MSHPEVNVGQVGLVQVDGRLGPHQLGEDGPRLLVRTEGPRPACRFDKAGSRWRLGSYPVRGGIGPRRGDHRRAAGGCHALSDTTGSPRLACRRVQQDANICQSRRDCGRVVLATPAGPGKTFVDTLRSLVRQQGLSRSAGLVEQNADVVLAAGDVGLETRFIGAGVGENLADARACSWALSASAFESISAVIVPTRK